MTGDNNNLLDLRREIDDIDDALHDLLMRRASLVEHIKQVKEGDGLVVFHPGREAEILRRLAMRHSGSLPLAVVVRIWRELISAFVGMQGPFSVAIWDTGGAGCWDIARDHFGTKTTMTPHKSARAVLNSVAKGDAALGVLPAPQDGQSDPWWLKLCLRLEKRIHICARIPFSSHGNSRDARSDALVISANAPEPSGDDHSFLLVECDNSISRGRLTDILTGAGLKILSIVGQRSSDELSGQLTLLVEVAGFVLMNDERLSTLITNIAGIVGVEILGAYAMPLGKQVENGS